LEKQPAARGKEARVITCATSPVQRRARRAAPQLWKRLRQQRQAAQPASV